MKDKKNEIFLQNLVGNESHIADGILLFSLDQKISKKSVAVVPTAKTLVSILGHLN